MAKAKKEKSGRIVLVGTYKGDQLTQWRGWYNYPVGNGELGTGKGRVPQPSESVGRDDPIAPLACVNELWLFNGTKDERRYKAEFVGIKTREELIRDYGYLEWENSRRDAESQREDSKRSTLSTRLSNGAKPHGIHYALFKTQLLYRHKGEVPGDAERVIIRTKDFARSPEVRKQLKAYLESPDRNDPDLAKRLPEIITRLRPEQLRVCDAAVQLQFLSIMFPPRLQSVPDSKRNVISLFSGAMGLDNGIEKAGLNIRLCVEFQHSMAETIRANRPEIPLVEDDVRNYSGADLMKIAGLKRGEEVFLVCGGPPCQAFSTAGKRLGFDDERGNVFLKYIDLIGEIRPKYFLLENVRGLLSASYVPHSQGKSTVTARSPFKGSALLYALERIKAIGYSATFTLYDSANYGVPQRRERVIILGSRDGYQIPLIPPTHSEKGGGALAKWRTFRSAVKGLTRCTSVPIPKRRLKYFQMLGPGECWHNLPEGIQREAMGKSYELPGGKTGFYRRLAWDEPSPTLVTCPTMPATDLMHPVENRALSIEEYARIQMFPDDWCFKGSLPDIYKQIGNAVPVGMGYAAAKHLLWFDSLTDKQKGQVQLVDPSAVYSRYRNTSFLYFDQLREMHNVSSEQGSQNETTETVR